MKRRIIKIAEEKCDGCGQCATACAEGAIQIIDGKARLVSEVYCDGLGACLGTCPQGAITIEEREAPAFDEEKTKEHLAQDCGLSQEAPSGIADSDTGGRLARVADSAGAAGTVATAAKARPSLSKALSPQQAAFACPGAAARMFAPQAARQSAQTSQSGAPTPSSLGNWPVQLRLVPPNAPYFQNADLLLVADCVPFAFPDFHQRFLAGKALVIACPKLDDNEANAEKIAQVLSSSSIRSLTVMRMEVPCCGGLVQAAQMALQAAGKDIPFKTVVIGIRGEVLEEM